MGKLIREYTVAPDEKELKKALPEVECISQALLNKWILKDKCRTINSTEFRLPTGERYFKVLVEMDDAEESGS